mmetsp:Transcript_19708/g.54139  ORF Transcript_19708/g.54139 Transcript_19708/m.54139 type:complete len:714 (+) Transcript_19708:61-2202(+)
MAASNAVSKVGYNATGCDLPSRVAELEGRLSLLEEFLKGHEAFASFKPHVGLNAGVSELRRPPEEAGTAPAAEEIGAAQLERAPTASWCTSGTFSSIGRGKKTPDVADTADGEVVRVYTFSASMWDVAMFLFNPKLGFVASLQVAVLLVLNMLLQALFCYIIKEHLANGEWFETADYIKRWRRSVAHDYNNVDHTTYTSMARRVCQGDLSLHQSNTQVNIWCTILDYMAHENAIFPGPALSVLAVLLFVLPLSKELDHITLLVRGVFNKKRANGLKGTRFVETGESTIVIQSLGRARFAAVLCVVLLRLGLWVYLAIGGVRYLTRTPDLADIVLNCLALQFVLEIDEMIFDTLAPSAARSLIGKLEPLEIDESHRVRKLGIQSTGVLLFVGLVVAISYMVEIRALIESVNAVRHEMCSGVLDFTYGVEVTGAVYVTATKPYDDECCETFYPQQAVHEVVTAHQPNTLDPTLHDVSKRLNYSVVFEDWYQGNSSEGLFRDFQARVGYTGSDLARAINPDCENQKLPLGVRSFLGSLVRKPVHECGDAIDLCSSVDTVGVLVRASCPITCECAMATAKFIHINSDWGCPERCLSSGIAFAPSSCSSRTPEELLAQGYWANWIRQLESVNYTVRGVSVGPLMRDHGCGIVAILQNLGNEVCGSNEYEAGLRSLVRVCPTECGCTSPSEEERNQCEDYAYCSCPEECAGVGMPLPPI